MKEEELRELYSQIIERRTPSERGECPSPDELREVVERSGAESDRLRILDHVMACGSCRPEFELLRAVAAARPRRRRVPRSWLAAAAMIAAIVGGTILWQAMGEDGARNDVVRGGEDRVRVAAPRGELSGMPERLVWHAVPSAVRYEAEIVDEAGAPIFSAETRDTVVPLEAAQGLEPGGEYLWWVRAVFPDGRRVRSDPERFSIQP